MFVWHLVQALVAGGVRGVDEAAHLAGDLGRPVRVRVDLGGVFDEATRHAELVLDGAQDSDDPGVVAALGMPMGVGG
ncbi:MAG: hypothetical protein JO345_38640 [Streptosporangiaceae bacterium]|nr:hypothetical protein [Streptosporangiaceae bacterium]